MNKKIISGIVVLIFIILSIKNFGFASGLIPFLVILLALTLFAKIRGKFTTKKGDDTITPENNGTISTTSAANLKNSESITCEFCSKPLGLNRYAIGKTASGKTLWKCPECAKKGGYVKIVDEKAYMCTADGEIIETKNYNEEIRIKCNICGHIYCYTQSDIDENERIKKAAVRERGMAVGNALFGSQLGMHGNTNRADNLESQIVDYNKCPKCNSTDIHELTESEFEEMKAQKSVESPTVSSADELKKFKELLDSGVITQEEFEAKKKQLLGL